MYKKCAIRYISLNKITEVTRKVTGDYSPISPPCANRSENGLAFWIYLFILLCRAGAVPYSSFFIIPNSTFFSRCFLWNSYVGMHIFFYPDIRALRVFVSEHYVRICMKIIMHHKNMNFFSLIHLFYSWQCISDSRLS